MNLLKEANAFLEEAENTLLDALPLVSDEDMESVASLNEDNNIVVGVFSAPLIHGAGQSEDPVKEHDYTSSSA